MAKVVFNPKALMDLRKGLAFGVLNFAYAVEADAKRDAPVRGGHRSFLTTKKTKAGREGTIPVGANNGSVLIGGTLRRSIHSVAYNNGLSIAGGSQVDENGKKVPAYQTPQGIVAYVGTNCDYGAYVEIGTVKMTARPFLAPALDKNLPKFDRLVAAGMKKAGYG